MCSPTFFMLIYDGGAWFMSLSILFCAVLLVTSHPSFSDAKTREDGP